MLRPCCLHPARGVGLVCCPYVLVGPFTVRLTVSGLPVLVICATATKDSVGAPVRTSLLTPWVTIVGASKTRKEVLQYPLTHEVGRLLTLYVTDILRTNSKDPNL